MSKVYLETSFFSACVSTKPSAKSKGWRASSLEWWRNQARHFEIFISNEVIRELAATDFQNSKNAMAMLSSLKILEETAETASLAEVFVKEHVMPGPAIAGDAVHVAVATVHQMDYLLTWNVKHLANPNKRTHFAIICMRLGLSAPILVTPDMLQQEMSDE